MYKKCGTGYKLYHSTGANLIHLRIGPLMEKTSGGKLGGRDSLPDLMIKNHLLR